MEGTQQQCDIQVCYDGNTKTIVLALSATEDNWNSLAKKVCEAFEINDRQATSFKMKYTDDEGDLVSLDSDSELRQALQAFDSKTPLFSAHLQRKKLSREERMNIRQERMKIRLERLERKKQRLARQEAGPTAINQTEVAETEDRLAKKQKRREERLRIKAERVARRPAQGDTVIDEDARRKRAEDKASRRQEKLLLKQQRLERKQERMARRQERCKRKAESAVSDPSDEAGATKPSAEERKLLREEQKRMRCGARQARAERSPAFYSLEDGKAWPEDGTQLYLDGNNMMYLTAELRNLTLKKRASGKAETLLESVAEAFVAAMGDRIKQTVLIFDHTRTEKTSTFANGTTLRVCSARPRYPTSDDQLIDWAKQAQDSNQKETGKMVFVTADRALSVQLQQAGGILIKPKQFLCFACQLVRGSTDIDAWLDSFLA